MDPPKAPKKNKQTAPAYKNPEKDEYDPLKMLQMFYGFFKSRPDAAGDLLNLMHLMNPHQHNPLAMMKHELSQSQKHYETLANIRRNLMMDATNNDADDAAAAADAANIMPSPSFFCPQNYQVYPIHNFEVWTKNAAGAYKIAPMILDRGSHENIIGVHWLWNKRLLGKQIWLQCKTDDTKFFRKELENPVTKFMEDVIGKRQPEKSECWSAISALKNVELINEGSSSSKDGNAAYDLAIQLFMLDPHTKSGSIIKHDRESLKRFQQKMSEIDDDDEEEEQQEEEEEDDEIEEKEWSCRRRRIASSKKSFKEQRRHCCLTTDDDDDDDEDDDDDDDDADDGNDDDEKDGRAHDDDDDDDDDEKDNE